MTKKLLLTLVCGALAFGLSHNAGAADAMTPEAFAKGMKAVGKFNKDSKGLIEAKTADKLSADAAEVSKTYAGMIAFWKGRKVDDAAKWSEESSTAAKGVSDAAKAGDWDKVKASMGALTKNCKNCHDAHREKEGDTYKIK